MANKKNNISSTITLEQKAELNAKINMIKSLTVDVHGLSNGLQNLTSDEVDAINNIISILEKSNLKETKSSKTKTTEKPTSVKDYYNVSDIVDLTKIVPAVNTEEKEETSKKATNKKTSTKKTPAKKTTAKKTSTKKSTPEKTSTKKATSEKSSAKKTAAKKTPAKKTTSKAKTPTKKTSKSKAEG